jgi:hypothetical protein
VAWRNPSLDHANKTQEMEQHALSKMGQRARSSEQRYRLDVLKNPVNIRLRTG